MTEIKDWNLPTKELIDFNPEEKNLQLYFYENIKFDKSILFYHVSECPMLSYSGKVAIFTSKQAPRLLFDSGEKFRSHLSSIPCSAFFGKAELFGFKVPIDDLPCQPIHDQRTVVGVTDQNHLVVFVSDSASFDSLRYSMNRFSSQYGNILDANMFDGGGSPAIMFEGEVTRYDDPIMSALLIYSDEYCSIQ